MNSYLRTKAISNNADSLQKSGFFDNYGDKLGLFFSIIWIIAGSYIIYLKYKDNSNLQKSSKKDYIIPIIILLLGIIVISLYFILNMNNVDEKITNNVVGHISLTPIYLLIIAIAFNSRN